MTKLKDIAFKLAYDHYEAESCRTEDADKLALAIRAALEEERERCAKIAEAGDPNCSNCDCDPQACSCPDTAKLIAKGIRES